MKSSQQLRIPTLYDSAITESITRDARLNEIAQLLVALGRSLHEVGHPAHKVERTLVRVAERFQVPLQMFVVPTCQFISIHREEGPITFVIRVLPGAVDLDRLSKLMSIADALAAGKMTPLAARAKLDKTMERANVRSGWSIALAYVLSAAPFSVFFGGGRLELIVSTLEGLAVGIIAIFMLKAGRSGRPFELVAAGVAAFIAGSADQVVGAYGGWIPLAAGLIVLLPGIALVDSLEELANGQLASGSSRLAGVGVVFLALTFGSVVGYAASEVWGTVIENVEATHLPEWFTAPALLVVALGSTLRFRARLSDYLLILGASTLALLGTRLGKELIGPLAGPFLATVLLGIAGRTYARFSRRAAELIVVPGIALLVPGSVGYRSMESLLSQDATVGVTAAFEMFLIGMALVAGLLFSNSIVPERSRA